MLGQSGEEGGSIAGGAAGVIGLWVSFGEGWGVQILGVAIFGVGQQRHRRTYSDGQGASFVGLGGYGTKR